MRILPALVFVVGCAARAPTTAVGGIDPHGAEGAPADAAVPVDAALAARETAWLVAHLADDPDPANPRESDAVRRLSALGENGLRAAVEVFRVGDERRVPFARRVFERVIERRCRHAPTRVLRTLRAMQGEGTSDDGGESPRWLERSRGRWSNEAVERARAWIDAGARCAE